MRSRPITFKSDLGFRLPHSIEHDFVAGFISRTIDECAQSARSTFFELDVTSNVETVDFEGIAAHLRPRPALIVNAVNQ